MTLFFCSDELISTQLNCINKKFIGYAEDEIQGILTSLGSTKSFDYEQTLSPHSFVSNFWKFDRIINKMVSNLQSETHKEYIFFETLSGFNFKTISYLLSQEPIQTLVNTKAENFMFLIDNINEYQFNTFFDIISYADVGFFGTTYYKWDTEYYNFIKTESILSEAEDDIITLGKSSFYDIKLSNKNNLISENYQNHDIIYKRMVQWNMLSQYNMVCRMHGDFNRKCGQNITMSFPNIDNSLMINNHFDNKWFIHTIRHIIRTTTEYEQNIVLCKNSAFNNSVLRPISGNYSI